MRLLFHCKTLHLTASSGISQIMFDYLAFFLFCSCTANLYMYAFALGIGIVGMYNVPGGCECPSLWE